MLALHDTTIYLMVAPITPCLMLLTLLTSCSATIAWELFLHSLFNITYPHAVVSMVWVCRVEEVEFGVIGLRRKDTLFKLNTCTAQHKLDMSLGCCMPVLIPTHIANHTPSWGELDT
eukprot:GHRR01025655.1.p1 GENE.GHRR01025655.1~~GHRR01025655.1.p1  ORF type:complete len:117 (-),score=7.41 GHRR01025655.1:506-856(-)